MKQRRVNVYFQGLLAGVLAETAIGYSFVYDENYLKAPLALPISLTFPLRQEPFTDKDLFPFFRNLIPEGWLFEINARTLKIDQADHFGLLMATGADCIGAVSIRPIEE